MCCENETESLEDSLLYMLQKAPRLDYLDLQAVLPVGVVDTICNLQQQRKIGESEGRRHAGWEGPGPWNPEEITPTLVGCT